MPGWLFALLVVFFAVVAFLIIRTKQRGRIVERLPLHPDETVLLEEEGLKVFHRFRQRAVRGGGTVTHRARAVLTDKRILVATGGPEGKQAFVIVTILDYSAAAPSVANEGYPAYREKFQIANGYPTYPFTLSDVTIEPEVLRIDVPFPEAGSSWGPPPQVKLYTQQAERYRAAIAAV